MDCPVFFRPAELLQSFTLSPPTSDTVVEVGLRRRLRHWLVSVSFFYRRPVSNPSMFRSCVVSRLWVARWRSFAGAGERIDCIDCYTWHWLTLHSAPLARAVSAGTAVRRGSGGLLRLSPPQLPCFVRATVELMVIRGGFLRAACRVRLRYAGGWSFPTRLSWIMVRHAQAWRSPSLVIRLVTFRSSLTTA